MSCYLSPMRQRHGRSLTEDVYEQLRASVLHGDVTAGDRLPIDALARQYDVSLSVIREAVTRLAAERLVEATPQAGFRVRPVSPEHLADLTWARCQIEQLVVAESIRSGDLHWEAALVAANHVLVGVTPRSADGSVSPAWMDAHRRFHATLAAGCPNVTMLVLRQQLFDEAELYRHRSAAKPGIERDIANEHREILDAALRRDADGTAKLIVRHLQRTAMLAVDINSRGD